MPVKTTRQSLRAIGNRLPLGNVLAAPIAGAIADGWGYSTLLAVYALFALIIPITALFIKDRVVAPQEQANSTDGQEAQHRLRMGSGLYLVVAATFLMSLAGFVNMLGLSLAMHTLTFSSANRYHCGCRRLNCRSGGSSL